MICILDISTKTVLGRFRFGEIHYANWQVTSKMQAVFIIQV